MNADGEKPTQRSIMPNSKKPSRGVVRSPETADLPVGVYLKPLKRGDKYEARPFVSGRIVRLGSFDTPAEAVAAIEEYKGRPSGIFNPDRHASLKEGGWIVYEKGVPVSAHKTTNEAIIACMKIINHDA